MELTTRIPPELWFKIIELLDTQDLKALSGICSTMSNWLAPRLFSCLRLSNQSTDLELMGRFLERHGNVVTAINYQSFLFPNKEADEDDGDEEKSVLCMSPVLQDLLRGNGVPNLKSVTLTFHPEDDFNTLDVDWTAQSGYGDGSIYIHQEAESSQEVHTAESTYQWRADIHGAFDAISHNITLQHLEIQDLIPRQCSVWKTKKWKTFLGRLPSLKLGIWGGDNGAGWHSNTLEGYYDFVKNLRPDFFKHLTGLRQLHLKCEEASALGCEGMNHSPLPISPDDLPSIEELELENWFIDPALQNFLSARKDTIRRIVLTNCKSADLPGGGLAENPISWATFFRSIRELQPPNLTQFLLGGEPIKLDWREYEDEAVARHQGYDDNTRAAVNAIRKQLSENKNLRLFAYAYLDDKYGNMTEEEEHVRQSFDEGQDQMEYDALMDFVAKNAAKGGAESKLLDSQE